MPKEAVLAIGWVGAARMQHPMSTFANTFLYMTRALLDRRGWSAEPGRRIPLWYYNLLLEYCIIVDRKADSR